MPSLRSESAACPIVMGRTCRRRVAVLARQSSDGLETGGALFGKATARGVREITHSCSAGPNADRRPDYFLRDLVHTQREALRLYQLDGSEWIGEWHTHPSGELLPSPRDLQTYLAHLGDPELEFSCFIALLVAPQRNWTTGMLWVIEATHAQAWMVSLQ